MLDSTTKKRIDDARDTLVGKLPDPKSQVEQITIALIYKFMDDMDRASVKLGGKAKFFSGAFKDYAWDKVFDTKLAGHEVVKAYGDAIQQLDKNPNVPQLFRNIFKNAYLPYRDPETLKSFLTIIDEFEYDHSEKLGDAFEYLLSVLGSQGEVGQFRTPRHIIDFIVEIVNPQKNEKILDPACGTAGFLISAYKHILKQNSKNFSPDKDSKSFAIKAVNLNEVVIESKGFSGDKLTSDDRTRLVKNIFGYDISPDMIRLSLVNLYLHGFPDPKIAEYDTLTSEDRWNEYADVILANPPFMTPKGGIKPHKRFSIQSNRSELLFIDYILEHLSSNGRAGIIVPEGIIFNSQNAFAQTRKLLLEKFLVAVVSLPTGVFNPYSNVKTSILIIDKDLANKTRTIAFFKADDDGYDLGAQRRAIDKNDLPQVFAEISDYLQRVRGGQSLADYDPKLGFIVDKEKIASTVGYSLSGEQYRVNSKRFSQHPHIKLGDVVEILDSLRRPITRGDRKPGPYPYYGATGVLDHVEGYIFDEPLVLVGEDGAKWGAGESTAFAVTGKVWVNNHAHVLRPKRDLLLDRYLIEILNEADLTPYVTGVTVPKLNQERLRSIQIPLPPLNIQKQIVAEIEEHQTTIARFRNAIKDEERKIQAALAQVWGEAE